MTARKKADPFKQLMKEHAQAKKLCVRIKSACERTGKIPFVLFEKLTQDLSLHMEVEERILYPALKNESPVRDVTLEGYEEHHVAKVLIAELKQRNMDPEVWCAKFKVLSENLDHHIKEEHEKMFPKARKALDAEEESLLAGEMRNFRVSKKAKS